MVAAVVLNSSVEGCTSSSTANHNYPSADLQRLHLLITQHQYVPPITQFHMGPLSPTTKRHEPQQHCHYAATSEAWRKATIPLIYSPHACHVVAWRWAHITQQPLQLHTPRRKPDQGPWHLVTCRQHITLTTQTFFCCSAPCFPPPECGKAGLGVSINARLAERLTRIS